METLNPDDDDDDDDNNNKQCHKYVKCLKLKTIYSISTFEWVRIPGLPTASWGTAEIYFRFPQQGRTC
jgi:hypothetical protein